jgi:LacI family transcriptional regulator
VDGAVLCPSFANLYSTHISQLKRRDLPMVTIDLLLPPSFRADAVLSDETLGARVIAEHLLSLGHREVVHFAGPSTESWSRERRTCFAEAMRGHPGTKVHFVEVSLNQSRLPIIREAMEGLSKVTAAYCATDDIAEEVYGIATELGRKIPEDLSVIGYGNLNFGTRLTPTLTTVRQRPFRMGKAAANLVLDRIESEVLPEPRIERLPVELVTRSSTAPAAT